MASPMTESASPLVWPRFCYNIASPSLPVRSSPNKKRPRSSSSSNHASAFKPASASPSTVRASDTFAVPPPPLKRRRTFEPRVVVASSPSSSSFFSADLADRTYSNLMKRMAEKYQQRQEEQEK